jgi:DNA-binding Lrp family transcriptional regulator
MKPLDEIDRRMIDVLRQDGRISVPALATRLSISRASAYSRFERLIADGVIDHFEAVVSPEKLGLTLAALVLVNLEQNSWRETHGRLRALPGVEWVGLATGPFDVALLVRTDSLAALRDVVLVRLHEIPTVRSAQSFVLLDEQPTR